ncbi:MAG: hypothetical protein IT542_04995 [Rubellimicrobium sp.]|nr:hypothetical protein [Rubellimicrobium sp.]
MAVLRRQGWRDLAPIPARIPAPILAWTLACTAVLVLVIPAFGREYRAAVMLRRGEEAVLLALRDLDPAALPDSLPDSLRARTELMEACGDLLLASPAIRVSPVLARGVAASCAAAAAAILRRDPALAPALAAALVATVVGGDRIAGAAYAAAAAAAPHDPWPLGTRLLAAERQAALGPLPDDLAAPVAADVARALGNDPGRRLVAGIHLRQPGLRPLIGAAAAGLSAGDQRAFLGALRAAADG